MTFSISLMLFWVVDFNCGVQSSPVANTTQPWHVYSFETKDSLYNTYLAVKKHLDFFCNIAPSNKSLQPTVCNDMESEALIANSSLLILVTKLQNEQFFLENGNMKSQPGIYQDAYSSIDSARQHFFQITDVPHVIGFTVMTTSRPEDKPIDPNRHHWILLAVILDAILFILLITILVLWNRPPPGAGQPTQHPDIPNPGSNDQETSGV
ncbi:uncharacterized protein [Pyxicephalus adspersus]|uniref:uncharacterized protein n=1 Tax=Pyxicephalus adspersus TaxID=30357 RepID=UPI003B5BC1E4